jgi:hypothetical protein
MTIAILIALLVGAAAWVGCLRDRLREVSDDNDRLRDVVRGLAQDHTALDELVKRLERENASLRDDNDCLRGSLNIACAAADDPDDPGRLVELMGLEEAAAKATTN